MSIDTAQRGQAKAELRQVVSDLECRVDQNRLDGSTMIFGCRRVLNLWVDTGGSSLEDPVIGFLGIESQSGHVLGGTQVQAGRDVDRVRFEPGSIAERVEVDEIGRFFGDSFIISVRDLARHLDRC